MITNKLEVNPDSAPGTILDLIIRKANILDMVDTYLGARVDYASGDVSVFFTEEATQEQLEALEETLEDDSLSTQVEQVDEKPIAWMLHVTKVVEAGATQATSSGDVSVDVPLSGEVDVVDKGSQPDGPQ